MLLQEWQRLKSQREQLVSRNPKHFLNAEVRKQTFQLLWEHKTGVAGDLAQLPPSPSPVTSNQHRNRNRNMKETANLSNPPPTKPKALPRCSTNPLQSHTPSWRRNKFFRRSVVPKWLLPPSSCRVMRLRSLFFNERTGWYQERARMWHFSHCCESRWFTAPLSFPGPRSTTVEHFHSLTQRLKMKKVKCLCRAHGFCTPLDELSPNYAWGLHTGILQEFFPAYTGAKIPGANIPIQLGMCNFNASCT